MNPLRLAFALLAGSVAASAATLDFGPWAPGTSPQEIGRRVAANFLPRPYMPITPDKAIHYAETCTWYGALNFAQLTDDAPLAGKLVERFEPLFGPKAKLIPRCVNVDNAVFGAVPLQLFRVTKDTRYLTIGQTLADQQWNRPADLAIDAKNTPADLAPELSWHTRFWIDDMYMITILQAQAYRATGDRKYLDRAATEAVAYLEKLQQPNGLFHHAPHAPFFWGRGNGWFAAGMSELLSSMPADHPLRARIMAGYQKMMATLLQHQDADGMWHQLIDDPNSWPETSSTGMFTFAFITGVKNGWLDEKSYAPAARKGWLRMITYLNDEGSIREVCAGTSARPDRQYYLDRPRLTGDLHGQAPVLWCANALLR